MKKQLAILLAVALLAALFAGCAAQTAQAGQTVQQTVPTAQPTESDSINLLPAKPEVPGASEELPIVTAPEQTEAPTEAPTEVDYRSMLYDLIDESVAESGSYTQDFGDGYTTQTQYSYYVPRLTAHTAGAKEINDRIESDILGDVRESLSYVDQKISVMLLEVDWYVDIWDGVLSLIVYEELDWGSTYYFVYYYDLETGKALDAREMLQRAAITEDAYLDGVRTAARETFESNYSAMDEQMREANMYYEMLEYAQSDELINLEMVPFYITESGEVVAFVPVASLAGASYYYEELTPEIAVG